MRVLVIDGWTREGNAEHERAGCLAQSRIFENLVAEARPDAVTTVHDTHRSDDGSRLDLESFDAAVWSGGGGNIYKDDEFNRRQLALCERVLKTVPYFWGSCWGMQVAVTVLGGKIAASTSPEFGIARNIKTRKSDIAEALYAGKASPFDAPTHHSDEIVELAGGFEILAENPVTVQAIISNDRRIFCTQYHPELPYDMIAKLLRHWAPNYRAVFDEMAFEALLTELVQKEPVERRTRATEFKNWLDKLANGDLAVRNGAAVGI